MSSVTNMIQFILANWQEILVAISALLLALIMVLKAAIKIAIMIPGAEPETTLQKVVDALQRYVDRVESVSKK